MKNRISVLLSTILIVCLVAGCTEKNETAVSKVTTMDRDLGQVLNVAVSADPALDKMDAASYEGMMEAQPLIYDALVEYGPKGQIQRGLAESWDISEEGKTYTFHLVQGVRFSDGSPFNAEVVKFNTDRWNAKANNSWLTVARNLKDVKVIDENTVSFSFIQPYYLTLSELAYARPLRMMSPTAVEPAGDPGGQFIKPIGTGAWLLDSYTRDTQTVLVPNTHYWGSAPKLAKLVLKVISDPQTRVLALQNGEVDMAGGDISKITLENLSMLNQADHTEVMTQDGTTTDLIIFNNSNPALANTSVRQAINYAIDKNTIDSQLFDGTALPAKGLFAPTNPYVTAENNQGYTYNLEKAQQLLNAAGWTDTNEDGILEKDGKPLILSLVLQTQQFPEWKSLSEVLQQQLAQAGIQLDIKIMEESSYYNSLWTSKNYDMLIYRSYADVYNPYGFLSSLFYQSADNLAVAYGDKLLSGLLDKVASSNSEEERVQIYNRIFSILHEQAATVPLLYPSNIFVTSSRVQGFEAGPTTFRPVDWNQLSIGSQ